MFYEDHSVGAVVDLGKVTITRESILAYARAFDPRVLARAARGEPLTASGLHVGCVAMRALVDWRDGVREAMAASGAPLPPLGVSPGLTDVRWPHPVHAEEAVSFTLTTTSLRETRKPDWGLVGSLLLGVNSRGVEVFRFRSLVLTARRPA